jgi:hypothetical protein
MARVLRGVPLARLPRRVAVPALTLAFVVLMGRTAAAAPPPAIGLWPSAAPPGSSVTLRGTGFPADRPGRILWQGTAAGMPAVRTTAAGTITVQLTVPDRAPGVYEVTVQVERTAASAPFIITTRAPVPGRAPAAAVVPPAPRYRIELGEEEPGLAADIPLGSFPDAHISMLATGGDVSVWLTGEVRSYLLRGPDLDRLQPYPPAGSTLVPVLEPGGAGFDGDYAGFGSIQPAGAPGLLVGLYHAERCRSGSYTAAVGLAVSADGGTRWERRGPVITGRNTLDTCAKDAPRGAGQPSAVRFGDYLYLYYTDWGGDIPDAIHVARAPLAHADIPAAWRKYFQGAFTEPGIGGRSTPVIQRAPPEDATVYAAHPSVSWNVALGRLLAVFESRDGFYAATSADGVTWDPPQRFMAFPTADDEPAVGSPWYAYASLLSPTEPSHLTTGERGYLYYAKKRYGLESHRLMRRPFRIVLGVPAP